MAVQMLGIKTKFTDDQGRPLVGGKVHAYFAGTTTYQDTFKDPDMTIVNTNPIILDDSGSADVYLNGSYRIRIFDKNDVLIEEQDGVTQSASGEITTAKGEIIGLYGAVLNSLTNEVKRAVAAEKTIADSLTSETTRAKSAESALQSSIGDETTRAKSAESALQSSIGDETTRAKKAESDLNADIIKEVSDRESEVARLDEVDAVLQAQINSIGGGKLAYKTYAEMIADKSNIAAKSSIDVLADTDDKNGTYLYDGANFVKSQYDLEKLIRAKVQNTFGTYAQMVASNLSDGSYALVTEDVGVNNGIYFKEGGVWVKSNYDVYSRVERNIGSIISKADSYLIHPVDMSSPAPIGELGLVVPIILDQVFESRGEVSSFEAYFQTGTTAITIAEFEYREGKFWITDNKARVLVSTSVIRYALDNKVVINEGNYLGFICEGAVTRYWKGLEPKLPYLVQDSVDEDGGILAKPFNGAIYQISFEVDFVGFIGEIQSLKSRLKYLSALLFNGETTIGSGDIDDTGVAASAYAVGFVDSLPDPSTLKEVTLYAHTPDAIQFAIYKKKQLPDGKLDLTRLWTSPEYPVKQGLQTLLINSDYVVSEKDCMVVWLTKNKSIYFRPFRGSEKATYISSSSLVDNLQSPTFSGAMPQISFTYNTPGALTSNALRVTQLSQSEYDALGTYDGNTLYVVR